MRVALILAFFAWVWESACGNASSTRITLPQGYVTGITIFTDSSTKVNAYLGLPYALPPIGNLRFAPPEKHPGWNRTLFAGHFRPDCIQPLHENHLPESEATNEDCLYLNVFVPESAMTYRNLPVVVFIHGVDYVSGSPLIVNAEELSKEGIIVVTFSYRLNVFGFLTFEDEFARGNLGLLDQYMAFVWVKENIQYFGGLSSNVTLMGHGSGASSVLVHMTSPRTKSSIFSPWLKSYPRSTSHPALWTSRNIARSLGCYGENYHGQKSRSVLACMRQRNSEEILKAFQSAYQNGNWSNALGPTSDDFLPPPHQYLPLDPTEAIGSGNYHKLPILTGITCNEGTIVLHNWRELIGQNDRNILHFIQNTAISNILEKYDVNTTEVRNVVTWNYLGKVPRNNKLVHQLLKLYNDAMFGAPFWRQTEALWRGNGRVPIFVYVFGEPSFDYVGNYGELLNLTSSAHGSEILFLFGPSLFQKESGRRFTAGEERLNVKMKRLWTNFIRSGDPTPPSYGYSLWDKFDAEHENYLKLYIDRETGRNLQKLSGNPQKEATTFWNSLLPSLHDTSKEKMKKLEELLVLAGASNIGPSYGGCSSYKSAMFTTLAFLILLLVLLVLSLIFLKKRTKERDRCIL